MRKGRGGREHKKMDGIICRQALQSQEWCSSHSSCENTSAAAVVFSTDQLTVMTSSHLAVMFIAAKCDEPNMFGFDEGPARTVIAAPGVVFLTYHTWSSSQLNVLNSSHLRWQCGTQPIRQDRHSAYSCPSMSSKTLRGSRNVRACHAERTLQSQVCCTWHSSCDKTPCHLQL